MKSVWTDLEQLWVSVRTNAVHEVSLYLAVDAVLVRKREIEAAVAAVPRALN
jgi:hypothetical protein